MSCTLPESLREPSETEYFTIVTDPVSGRVVWIGKGRRGLMSRLICFYRFNAFRMNAIVSRCSK